MGPNEWVKLLVIITVVVLPVLALTIILTSRLALKPIVEAVLRLRDGLEGPAAHQAAEDARFLGIEEELRQLHAALAELREAVEFQNQLQAPQTKAPRLAAARPALHVEPRAQRDQPAQADPDDFAQEYE